jgi:Flp pilus assembly protein TadD
VLALLSKPMVITFPLLLLLLDLWPLGRLRRPAGARGGPLPPSRPVREKVPLLALAVAAAVLTYRAAAANRALITFDAVPLATRLGHALAAYPAYLAKTFWPAGLALPYAYPGAISLPRSAGGLLLLGLVTLAAARQSQRRPWFPVGWAWFLGTLVPVIGLVQVSEQYVADRYTYVPLVGLFVALVWGLPLPPASRRAARAAVSAGGIAVLALLGAATWRQAGHWRDSVALFGHTLTVEPDNWVALNSLGVAETGRGRLTDAVGHLSRALAVRPGSALVHDNLGIALDEQGRTAEAIVHYREALRIRPDSPGTHNNLGVALEGQGLLAEAVAHYLEALRLSPGYRNARLNLGIALRKLAGSGDADARLAPLVLEHPGSDVLHVEIGALLLEQGRAAQAAVHFAAAVGINPDNAAARAGLERAGERHPEP